MPSTVWIVEFSGQHEGLQVNGKIEVTTAWHPTGQSDAEKQAQILANRLEAAIGAIVNTVAFR